MIDDKSWIYVHTFSGTDSLCRHVQNLYKLEYVFLSWKYGRIIIRKILKNIYDSSVPADFQVFMLANHALTRRYMRHQVHWLLLAEPFSSPDRSSQPWKEGCIYLLSLLFGCLEMGVHKKQTSQIWTDNFWSWRRDMFEDIMGMLEYDEGIAVTVNWKKLPLWYMFIYL